MPAISTMALGISKTAARISATTRRNGPHGSFQAGGIEVLDNVIWFEDNCNENNHHIVIGKENYYLNGSDGLLMSARKDQAPPDLRYFNSPPK